jgi:DNA-binding Lrp family transcriptional regulator
LAAALRDFGPYCQFVTNNTQYLLEKGHWMAKYSENPDDEDVQPNDVRLAVDETDRRLLEVLAVEARIPNNALAERVGIAPSTCLGRVRAMVASGVIRGFYADVDPEAVGHPLEAIIAIQLQADARHIIHSFAKRLAGMTEVRNVFFVAGGHDFFLRVATQDVTELRQFVLINLSGRPEIAATETNIVLEQFYIQRL